VAAVVAAAEVAGKQLSCLIQKTGQHTIHEL